MSRARRVPTRADPAPAAVRRDVLGTIVQQRRADIERELGGPADETGLDGVGIGAPNRDPSRGAASMDPLSSLLRPGLHLIAEIKRRSPSAGQLAGELDIVARARAYHAGGAAAISVLVEPRFFGGSLGDLRAVRTAVPVPLLAKEFVVDARQFAALRDAGADLVLLIAAMHPGRILAALVRAARDAGLEPLVEAHDRREAERAVASDARVIGINNRDLRTLHVDPDRAARLRDAIPDDRLAVVESGIRSPSDVEALLALGFDAALVGEALMRGGDEPREVAALTHAFVSVGRPPADAEDLPGAARRASVKICGITDEAGVLAAVAAGVDAIGLNFVRGTRRFLEVREAAPLAALIREARGDIARPAIVGIVADQAADEVAAIVREVGLERVQVSGTEPLGEVARIEAPVVRVLHVPPSVPAGGPRTAAAGHGPDGIDVDEVAGGLIERGRAVLALPNVVGLMLDAADPFVPGGTGIRVDAEVARRVALQLPVWLAGGLTPATVGEALRRVPAIGVDVASGVERTDASRLRPAKDPSRIALFAKRARAARADRPTVPARPIIASAGLVDADERGRWGLDRGFGGRYVPETLVAALVELEDAYARLRDDPRYWARIRVLGARYVGRPTPLYRADRLAAALEAATGREPGRLRLYLKREDLNHTGAHKINNALGQALLTRELGKADVVAETGAGQHGVATATACALLDLRCRVYMGAEDVRRQAPNVLRMHALGAEVVPVTSGSATLKDAINEAMRDWVTNVRTSHYVLGSAVGPHPFPTIVRDLQRVIGDEAAVQVVEDTGRLPDAVVACVGGGSNAIGLFARFIGEPGVRLVGVEAAGDGLQTPRHAAALAGGTPGILHGARSYLLQDADGQVLEAHSISAGLDYPGIGPQLSALFAAGRLEIEHATDQEALEGLRLVARTEGILAALEPSHAVAALLRVLAPGASQPLTSDAVVVLGMSGRGDKDLAALDPATE